MSTTMSNISERLREERKRLGLSQGQLADLLGIHRNTQARYERGEREPDTAYLDAIRLRGVDVAYVIGPNTGERVNNVASGEDRAAVGINNIISAYAHLIKQIGRRLGCSQDAADRLANFPANFSPVFWDGRSVPVQILDAFFEGCSIEIDHDLLTSILSGMDIVLAQRSAVVSLPKKAQAVAMLYRAFKASGKVDPAMIEEAVTLAAS